MISLLLLGFLLGTSIVPTPTIRTEVQYTYIQNTKTIYRYYAVTSAPISPTIQITTQVINVVPEIKYAHRVNQEGVDFISSFEGFSNTPYNDEGSHCTIGYGHLISTYTCNTNTQPKYISEVQAKTLLMNDIEAVEFRLWHDFPNTNLTQNQYNALVSYIFNIGWSRFLKTKIPEYLNNDKLDKIPDFIRTSCVDSGGLVWQGLVKRRIVEADLFAGKP